MKRHDLGNILIPFVYFIAGASALAGVATTFYYKEDLRLTIVQVQLLGSLSVVPWSIKPLYGFLSDRRPIWKLRRKPYLVLAGLLGAVGYFLLAFWVRDFKGAALAVILSGIGFALADVIVDGIVAERSRTQKEAGRLQSLCRASLMVGALLVAYLSGILVESLGPRLVFVLTGCLPLLTAGLALLISEEPAVMQVFDWKDTWRKFKAALNPTILWSTLFLFIWRSTPGTGGAFNYFVIDELHFTPEFFGQLTVVSRVMAIVGIVIFRKWLLKLPLRHLFAGIMIASVILSLPAFGLIYGWYNLLGVSPQFFALADEFVSAPLTEIAMLPMLVLVARVCPKGIEATMFALLASVMNIGLIVSDLGGAWLVSLFDIRQATETVAANYVHLDKVLLIAVLSSFLPWPLLRFLPDTRATGDLLFEPAPSALAAAAAFVESKSDKLV